MDTVNGKHKMEAELAVSDFSGTGAGILAAASTVISTFALVFVAEWGGRSFFSTIGSQSKCTAEQAYTWSQCARQEGDTECGYYIMRYMLEIVTRSDPTKAIDEVFQDKMAYSQDEIDEVRDLWANYFLNA